MTAVLLLSTVLPIHINARPSRFTTITVDPSSPDRLLAGTGEGRILRSVDGGASWDETQVVITGPTTWGEEHADNSVQEFGRGIQDSSPRLQMLLAERGITPAAMNMFRLLQRTNARLTEIYEIAVNPEEARHVFVAAADGVYHSTDGGRAFTRVYGPEAGVWYGGQGRTALSIAIDPFDTNSVLAGTDNGLYVSHDGGWGFHLARDTDGLVVRKIVFHPAEPGRVFLATTSGLLRSDDGGDTIGAVWGREAPGAGDATCVAVSSDVVLLGTADGLLLSVQRGEPGSFQMLPTVRARMWTSCAIDSTDAKHLFAGAEDGLYESVDGGAGWQPIVVGMYEPEHYFSPSLMAFSPVPVSPRVAARDVKTAVGGRVYIATTEALYRRDADVPELDVVRPRARSLPPLGELEERALAHTGIGFRFETESRKRLAQRSWLPHLTALFTVRERTGADISQDALYNLPFRYAHTSITPPHLFFFVKASWDLQELAFQALTHRTLIGMRLREVRTQVSEQVKRRWMSYQLARELDARTSAKADFLHHMYDLRMQEDMAYLDAMTGGVHESVSLNP